MVRRRLVVPEDVITIVFSDGRQAHLRKAFIANAEEIAAALPG